MKYHDVPSCAVCSGMIYRKVLSHAHTQAFVKMIRLYFGCYMKVCCTRIDLQAPEPETFLTPHMNSRKYVLLYWGKITVAKCSVQETVL